MMKQEITIRRGIVAALFSAALFSATNAAQAPGSHVERHGRLPGERHLQSGRRHYFWQHGQGNCLSGVARRRRRRRVDRRGKRRAAARPRRVRRRSRADAVGLLVRGARRARGAADWGNRRQELQSVDRRAQRKLRVPRRHRHVQRHGDRRQRRAIRDGHLRRTSAVCV